MIWVRFAKRATIGVGLLAAFSCTERAPETPAAAAGPAWQTTSTGLQYAVLDSGTGPHSRVGQDVMIHETMRHMNGTIIFDSYASNSPITFRLGAHQVIDGLDQAVSSMRVGARWLLIVPPSLSRRDVPCPTCDTTVKPMYVPSDTLRYDVMLLRVRDPAPRAPDARER